MIIRRRVIRVEDEEEGPCSDILEPETVLAERTPKSRGKKSIVQGTIDVEGGNHAEAKARFLTSTLKDEDKDLSYLRKNLAEATTNLDAMSARRSSAGFVSGANFLSSLEAELGRLKKVAQA